MRTITAADRSSLIRLASSLPARSAERRVILAELQKTATLDENPELEAMFKRLTRSDFGSGFEDRKIPVRLSNGALVDVAVFLYADFWDDGDLHFGVLEANIGGGLFDDVDLYKWTPGLEYTEKDLKAAIATAKAKFKAWKFPKAWADDLGDYVYSAVVSYEGTVLEVETFTDEFDAKRAAKGMENNVRVSVVSGAPQWNKT
jgi:hypothetical protein